MKISEAIVFALKSIKVKYVFGVSGANIEHLHDALARTSGGEIHSILAKSESGAAFMADAHARTHHTLGVCCSTSGGGMFNMLPGIAEAYSESAPLLAIIGQPPLSLEGRGGFQDSSDWSGAPNALTILKATTKWTRKIERAEDFWISILEAIRQALSGRQGPVALLIPRDLFEKEVESIPQSILEKCLSDANETLGSVHEMDLLFNTLNHAARPALLLGHGALRSRHFNAVTEFALRSNIPTATTLSARQLMPQRAPNYLGLVGAAGHPSAHQYLTKEADTLIVIGTGLSIMSRGPLGSSLASKNILAINVNEEAILRVAPHAHIILNDAGALLKSCITDTRFKTFQILGTGAFQREVLRPMDAPYRVSNKIGGIRQSEAIALIESVLPEHGHVVFDAGNCAAAALHWTSLHENVTSTIALGMGTMGYSVGGAIGAQLGSSLGSRTVAILGDGAFLMCGLEIHTAIELKLPILYIVFNNAGHGMCVTRQQLYFEGRINNSTYHDFDSSAVVKALAGDLPCFVAQAETKNELEEALTRFRANPNIPGIIEIRNYQEEWPPFAPFFKEVGPTMRTFGNFRDTLNQAKGKIS